MNDDLLLLIGIAVFGLAVAGIVMTILEFRRLPRRQPPQFDEVAFQAQPDTGERAQSDGRP